MLDDPHGLCQSMLIAQGLIKYYGNFQVLKGVDLAVRPGEIVAIMGASGAGKSTLLHLLATLDKPDGGTLRLRDNDLLTMRGDQLAKFRNQYIGFVFQFHNLLPEFTALENVCMPGYIGGFDLQRVEARGKELLALLDLEARAYYKPSSLSGGEKQRVAVARALMNNPYVVFADEPSGSLDSKTAAYLHDLLLDLRKKLGNTFIIATHNPMLANLADRKLLMEDGRLVESFQ